MENLKKLLLFMVVVMTAVSFSACSSDDDDAPQVDVTESYITGGTWYVTDLFSNGKWIDISSEGLRATFNADKEYRVGTGSYLDIHYYKGTWALKGNVVNGTTVDGIHETFRFVETNGNTAIIDYQNDDTPADNFRWKAEKRESDSTNDGIDEKVNWLNKNIVGEWYGYEYYATGRWITNDYFKDNKFLFKDDRSCIISGFVSGNCNDMYFIEKDGLTINLKIGQRKYRVFSIDKDKNEITLYDYAKIRKVK